MSNTIVTIRGSKLAPPGRRNYSEGSENGFVPVKIGSCPSSSYCLGEDKASRRTDDKYRKRRNQRKEKRLQTMLLFLLFSVCVLAVTMYCVRGPRVRLARKGERPHHNGHGSKKDWRKEKHHDFTRPEFDDNQEPELVEKESGAVFEQRQRELEEVNERMISNTNTTIRWANMRDVPPLPGQKDKARNGLLEVGSNHQQQEDEEPDTIGHSRKFFQVHRPVFPQMAWEKEYDAVVDKDVTARPNYVNYVHHTYKYPEKLMELPKLGEYPNMRTYKELMSSWPQDNLDNPPDVLEEDLIHFDWNIPADMKAAVKFRNAKLPFKVVNVPEVMAATKKWTDEYLSYQFDTSWGGNGPQSNGKCNEGPDNYFAFFTPKLWKIEDLGIPPTRDNDFTFERWAKHSVYADRVGLNPNLPHYYWQSGVNKEERYAKYDQWTFVSRDLPSFSTTEENFVLFHPERQKGIQCRFGERGITAANHYDGGRNMIAMVTGAKRYILSPPRACKQLGVVSKKHHASFRHSMLNYGHMALIDNPDSNVEVPIEEQQWLKKVGTAEAVSTVVKEGEILYVPTGWFHYITSLQKSAQCNVRSGNDMSGDPYWGSGDDISEKCFPQE